MLLLLVVGVRYFLHFSLALGMVSSCTTNIIGNNRCKRGHSTVSHFVACTRRQHPDSRELIKYPRIATAAKASLEK